MEMKMKTEEFDSQLVITCLQQKVTLFTDMLNLSKQIEVQTRQEEIILDDLLAKRKTLMDRIDKCNALVERQLSYLPETKRLLWQKLLHDRHYAAADEQESAINALVNKNHDLCLRIAEINRAASANLDRQRADLKKQRKGTKIAY